MEVVVGVATDKLNKLVDQAILQACYPFRFNNYVKELETEKEKLQSKIQDVLDRAKDATKRTHKVVSEVEKWLDEANFLMAKVMELHEKTTKRNKTSCLKHCPNLISRYSLAKQLEGMTKEIKKRNEVGFSKFSRLATLVGMNYYSQDFVPFDSRKVAYDGLLRALKDDEIHMIGLYAMGGSGKTTLVKEVGKDAEKFFDKVVFVVVSNPIDVRKIQGTIAGQLKLELKEEENPERAQRLFMRLTCGERFLIILDDVWEKLDFVDIGIPIANNQNGCTTLITTRRLDVCESMKCHEKIPLKGLDKDESWALFQKHAGLFDDRRNTFKDMGMALEITKECGGLPIAIAAIASALKHKPYDEWVKALKKLRDPSRINVVEELKDTYKCLQLSYDYLEDEVAKPLFLLCSVYPEDYEIQIDRLIIIGLGLGLAGEVSSYWTRTQVIKDAIKKLLDSCLLLKASKYHDSCVKMHDLVRDVAMWIAKKDNKLIMGQLKEDMIMKDNVIRYLWLEKVDKFPNNLNCPKLEFLYFSIYLEPCVTIKDDFFRCMEKLTVLIIENLPRQQDLALQLPISISLISNLCCLVLSGWVLGDISFIGRLERLESLTIRDCSFDELPKCIVQQKNLRLLYLCGCKIQRSPFEVMGSCSQLEVLYFLKNSGTDWEGQNKNSADFFGTISPIAPALESYCIQFGKTDVDFLFSKEFEDCNSFVARGLSIEDFENCISIGTSKNLMRRAKNLSLRGIPRSLKNIIPDLWQTIGGGMNELTRLFLHDSDGIECVIGHANNPRQFGIISNLTHLTLKKVKHLKTLCSGHASQNLFANLEKLCINSCDSLEHILKEDVKEIVDGSEYESYGTAFPKLARLKARNCKKLEYLMPISFAKNLAHLDTLSVEGCDELRSVFGQSHYEDLNLNRSRKIEFSALKYLRLQDLQNIISTCPENYHPTWPSLELLQLLNCPKLSIKCINPWVACGALRQYYDQMSCQDLLKTVVAPLETLQHLYLMNKKVEVVFDLEQLPISNQQVNSSLHCIYCTKLPQLKHIWRGPKNSLLLQHLSWLELGSCGYLKHVFPSSILKSLPQLGTLLIKDCNELEEIIEEDDQNVSNSHEPVFPRLVQIHIKCCHKLKRVFPKVSTCQVIPKLKALAIANASILEQVFGYEQHDTTLEYVLLWDLPSITSVAPSIALQTVKYVVVQRCTKLSLTSSITPQELLQQLPKDDITYYYLKTTLEDMIKSMDNYSGEATRQIDYQETGGPSNDQSLTFIASPNLTENEKRSEDQSADKQDTSEEKIVDGRAGECSASENMKIVTPLAHSEPVSSTMSANQSMHGLEMHTTIPTSSLRPESMSKQSTSDPVDLSLRETPNDETSVRDLEGQNAHKENLSKGNDVNGSFEGPPSTHSKLASFPPFVLVTSSTNTVPHIQSQIKLNSEKSDVDDLKDDDLISMLESMEEDYGGESPILSVPTVPSAKDELVAKAFADLEESLKMPLKEIASSEANNLRLRTSLNFLCRLSLEDGSLSNGVMSIVKSMHRDLPNIMSSFNQAFATVNKFAVLEERDKIIKDDLSQQKEVAIALVSKTAETQKLMNEAQEKEERLQEHISKLEKQRKDCEAELLSLQEQKRKYMAEAIVFKEKIETVRKGKSEMVEEQGNARQQLFQADHKWAVLCSQYEQHIANRNLT